MIILQNIKLFKNLYKKYFGETKYKVHVLTMYGDFKIYYHNNIKTVNELIEEINQPDFYQYNVVKIEKIRFFNFNYNKEIIHRKLGFRAEPDTEMVNVDGYEYSYPKIETNLTNVVRK